MLAEERWAAIIELVEQQKTATVQELAEKLKTSESTIRRDLTYLDQKKRLIKVHGGATCLDTQYVMTDQTMTEKYQLNSDEKEAIAEYAAGLIRPEDFVYIDAGTTTERLTDCIKETHAVYMTNSLSQARKLLIKGCRVILPGGELKPSTDAMVGPDTIEALQKYHFTIGFWGTNGVSAKDGFTTPEINEATVKRVSMRQTKNRYVLCDRSKFSRISTVTFAAFEDAVIITDQISDYSYKKYNNIVEVLRK